MDLNLLQKDVANTVGVSEDSITNWENNRVIPQIQFYPKIIDFLGYLPFKADKNTLPGRLKIYRHLCGLSQKQLGKILKVNESTVCGWERGAHKPNDVMNAKLSKILKLERYQIGK